MTSETFHSLEKRCHSLNRFIFMQWFLGFLIVVAISLFIYLHFMRPKEVNIPKKSVEKIVKKPSKPYNTILLQSNIQVPNVIVHKVIVHEPKKVKKKIKKHIVRRDKVIDTPAEVIKPTFTIKSTKLSGISALLKSNNEDENFDSVLKLAQYYLKHKYYQKAIHYAIKANHYNQSSFQPWLIYAKSKLKQHRKKEAIKAIKSYLSYYHSDDAKRFLLEMEDMQ